MSRYYVFSRTWWCETSDKSWPNGLKPHAGLKTVLRRNLTREEAVSFCRHRNEIDNPGRLSRKCEFDKQR